MGRLCSALALAVLAAAPALAQDSAWTLLEKGIAAFQRSDHERATALLEAALRADAGCHDAHYYLGRIHEKQRRFKDAVAHYQAISADWPTHSLAAERLGHIALRRGDLKGAAKHFAAHAKDRPSTAAWLQLASVQLDLGQHKAAEATLNEAAKFSKGDLALAEARGRLYMETERYREALDQYTAIIKKIPIDTTARYLRGVCLEQLERVTEARREWEEVLKRDPYNALTLRALVRHYEDDPGKTAEIKEYRRRLEILAKAKPRVRPVSGGG